MKHAIKLCFFSFFVFGASFSAVATNMHQLKYFFQNQTIALVASNGRHLGFWFELASGDLRNPTRSAASERAMFYGTINNEWNGARVLYTDNGRVIPLSSVPENARCEKGQFEVIDTCSPHSCDFSQGAILLSEKCAR